MEVAKKKETKTEKEEKKQPESKKLNYTLCIPSTVISEGNVKSLKEITQIAYQIAKNCTIYDVSEIVVLDIPEIHLKNKPNEDLKQDTIKIKFEDNGNNYNEKSFKKTGKNYSENSLLLASLLQFFITPPYLVKSTFKADMIKNFKYAKTFPKLSTLPFMNNKIANADGNEYPDKKVVKRKHIPGEKVRKNKKKNKEAILTKYVNIGKSKALTLIDQEVPINVRVTVNLKTSKVVSPIEAYGNSKIGANLSFGYHVRISTNFISIFVETPFANGYSSSIYVQSGDYYSDVSSKTAKFPRMLNIDEKLILERDKKEEFNLLLVYGKLTDYDKAFQQSKSELEAVNNLTEMFDGKLGIKKSNIRIEDAILISLARIDFIANR
ncbi:RNA methyltransferase [Ascoidea rubescens DSM 1968]|uniref:DUF171-domain-containing protein n=1 Tax=Ascoidea rubescens DSM 1968 TaxID=1344418 RepID=A0A1D2VLK7_9ASCO|nr:DUF171-domain-containing protein [Ascoidea rubescens DSM 1968]ODV62482.1 DUF171-domain-containing protein [Ascoidea rubescens DSM 1968]